jgi:cation diffusion facilitator CzcD-associated flavoprotein CzcO
MRGRTRTAKVAPPSHRSGGLGGFVDIAIVGAGVAGLATAKVLKQAGHEVTVFDRVADVGGVWSASRRYPGLSTQSTKAQYELSDFPMPRSFPEWPSGAQVQQYLEAYAAESELLPHIHLQTEVEHVGRMNDGRWSVRTRPLAEAGATTATFDGVVLANGVFSEPLRPTIPGEKEFTAAGGQLLAGTELHSEDQARGKHVVVIGYGKSACDVTVAVSEAAATTDVIARQLLWKVPRKINNVVNFKMLLLTRLGESLFRYRYLRGFEKFLHGPGNGIRRGMLNSIGSVSVRQFHLKQLDLVPRGQMEDIVKGAIGLATEGFFEGVEAGRIRVHRDQTIDRLLVSDGAPAVALADGTVLPADIVLYATGFSQGVPFLDEQVAQTLFDERGNFMLYRHIKPVEVAGLWFNGYNSSFFSPLNAEMAAVWIAADAAGGIDLPDTSARRSAVVDHLEFMDEAANGHHSRGTKIIPFSMHNVDEVLGDLHVNIPAPVRFSHWINPIAPSAYRSITPRVLSRLAKPRAAAPPTLGDRADQPSRTAAVG